ncbi:MAG: alpha/beta fold hydrolase [Ilumatobacteraceae bacterium]
MTADLSDLVVGSRHLHVVVGGAGTPSIVFLHGMGTSAASWQQCMHLLAGTHRVAAPDLIGHGTSPVPADAAEYTRDRTLVDLDELLADPAIALAAPVVLVGHSLGGYLALAHAAPRPGGAAGIVVLNTGPGYRDADKREAWNERSRRNAHRFGVPVQVADLNLQHDSIVMDRLAEIDVPVLALAGGADRPEYATSGEYLARKMRHASFVSVDGGEHSMHEATHADTVADLIDGFTRSLGR